MEQFNSYVQELETLIRATKWNHSAMMIAGDFNLKATALGGYVNDGRGTSLLNMFTKNGIVPIRMKKEHILQERKEELPRHNQYEQRIG
jgi:hypothetical protein